ncbi:XRE family transcriptional regulator [Clostridium tetani]|uniref:DNA binding protein n=1 Tax=Clostridium phage phiCT19406C TaxID=1567011 RepID=UPI00051467FD|nr:helix-turn-helix transcriptional regulator [Clostridium tetani]YP_009218090.1 DNA binding protein [Clostridium phage phiCT19406C]AJA42884.1 XRE family transcriptional regulator [Clostridium phage phiCT19406C]KGI42668.1 XRE family transcriptional regulator [Clostridium tetani]KHO33393.1 XRE family transcriptional regulator [Clostridium tetani]RXI63150.1 XRE family transcriptional regulator [Clostridium tetani]RXI63672.1 XRE family transcriptional regulator [Clostridium tetani]
MFGDRLKELREEKELTQEELGKFLNVSRQTVSGYESEAIEPNIGNLVKLADIFNVSLDYLLGRTKERYNLNLNNKKNKELILDIVKVIEKYK